LNGMDHSARNSDDEIAAIKNGGIALPDMIIANCIAQAAGGKA